MPTSIFIGRLEKPASPNAGWFANLADLPSTIGKIGTFETYPDRIVAYCTGRDDKSATAASSNFRKGAAFVAAPSSESR